MSGNKIAAALALVLGTAASTAAAAAGGGTVSALFENDIFFNQDRHYSTGVGLAYSTESLDEKDLWGLAPAAREFPLFEDHGDIRLNFELAQDIFTPTDTLAAIPDPADRPYAGYLFVALGLLSTSDTNMDQLQLQLGMVGPSSLASNSQNWVHDILNEANSLGWHYQLRDEPGIELTYERTVKHFILKPTHHGFEADIEPHYGAAIGNVYDYINGGLMLRVGMNLPDDFGPLRLDPGLPGSNYFVPDTSSAGGFWYSAYLFAGFDTRLVGRNIFLDGNSFHSSPSVDKNLVVNDLMFGFAVAVDCCRVAFTHVVRTREFKTQTSTDQFGAVSLTVRI